MRARLCLCFCISLVLLGGCDDDIPDVDEVDCNYADECGSKGDECTFEDDHCVVTMRCEGGEGPDTWRGVTSDCDDLEPRDCDSDTKPPSGSACPYVGENCYLDFTDGCATVQQCGDDHIWGPVETRC